jgi:hypothetical protein
MISGPKYTRFALHGYSPWSVERIIESVDRGTRIVDLPGDFTAVASGTLDDRPYTRIATSLLAAMPYYLARTKTGGLVHGPTVFEVVRNAGLPWRWNRRAITSLALLGHTVGEDTLHPAVTRAPCATVITVDGDNTSVERQDDAWTSVFAGSATDPDEAVATLEQVFREMAAPGGMLSLSAGFDSRLLLALALRAGHKPRVLTMGFDVSTDVRVARQIAAALDLDHTVVEVRADDYLAHARSIVSCTSGTKTAGHWHTDLYARAAGPSAQVAHYVGSNGEFARTFYLDRGLASRAIGAGPNALFSAYFAARMERRARRFPRALLAPGPTPWQLARAIAHSTTVHTHNFADALDCFYATERVRHFIGNGLALYAQHGAPRSPFLDARWIGAVACLPRAERLGSNHHRRAIGALWPGLMVFPVGRDGPIERRAAPLYYLRGRKPIGYSSFGEVLGDPRTREIIVESNDLDEILPRADRAAAVQNRSPAVELLLTLAFAAELGREAARA